MIQRVYATFIHMYDSVTKTKALILNVQNLRIHLTSKIENKQNFVSFMRKMYIIYREH